MPKRRSTAVEPEGTQTTIRGLAKPRRLCGYNRSDWRTSFHARDAEAIPPVIYAGISPMADQSGRKEDRVTTNPGVLQRRDRPEAGRANGTTRKAAACAALLRLKLAVRSGLSGIAALQTAEFNRWTH